MRKVTFTKAGIAKLPEDKPVMYRIETEGGRLNYLGVAKRGRVQERLAEHLIEQRIPGTSVQVRQYESIDDAKQAELRAIARESPKYNRSG